MNHIDIISLDALDGDPVTPTTGTYTVYDLRSIDGDTATINITRFDKRKGHVDGIYEGPGFISASTAGLLDTNQQSEGGGSPPPPEIGIQSSMR